MTRYPIRSALVVALLVLLLASCGNDDSGGADDPIDADPDPATDLEPDDPIDDDPDPATGVEPDDGVVDPDEPVESPGEDTGDTAPEDRDDFAGEDARERAQSVLGMFEADLDDDIRVARRGDEHFALTEDYVLGRLTVELDDDGHGYRVVSVTVELPDGPETYHLETE